MIIDFLSFNEWKTKKQWLSELNSNEIKTDERTLRKEIEKNNKAYAEGIVDFYIIHSVRGYKKTFNYEEIKKSIADNRKRAITMLIQASKAEKQMLRNMHTKLI